MKPEKPWNDTLPKSGVTVNFEDKTIHVDSDMTVLDFHREVCRQSDQYGIHEDQLDITCSIPTTRITNNIIELNHPYMMGHGFFKHMKEGTITEQRTGRVWTFPKKGEDYYRLTGPAASKPRPLGTRADFVLPAFMVGVIVGSCLVMVSWVLS